MKAAAKKIPPKEDVEFFYDVEQGSTEWKALHIGVPSASKFSTILASGRDGGDSKGRRRLLYRMAGEILTQEPAENYQNAQMLRGIEMEADALEWYERSRLVDLRRVGFVRRTIRNSIGYEFNVGCSPDALLGDHKAVEVKTMLPELIGDLADSGSSAPATEHRAQCQGTLWVTGRSEIDLVVFYRGMPSLVFTIQRDETYISTLAQQVETFHYEMKQIEKRLRAISP
jgi:hypothetical protein